MKTTDGDLNRRRINRPQTARGRDDACHNKNNYNGAIRVPSRGSVVLIVSGLLSTATIVGCLGTDNSPLVGRWEGQPTQASAAEGSDPETNDPSLDPKANFTSSLDFRPNYRFSMKLVGSDGQVRQTQGTWRIDQATGTRWEVTLQQDDSKDSVSLRIAFDEDGFTARQVDGDDRIESIHYRRIGD